MLKLALQAVVLHSLVTNFASALANGPICTPESDHVATFGINYQAPIEDASCAFNGGTANKSGSPMRFNFDCGEGDKRRWFPVPEQCFLKECPLGAFRFPDNCTEVSANSSARGNCLIWAKWYFARNVLHVHVDLPKPKPGSWNGVRWRAMSNQTNTPSTWTYSHIDAKNGSGNSDGGLSSKSSMLEFRETADDKRITITFERLFNAANPGDLGSGPFDLGSCFELLLPLVEYFPGAFASLPEANLTASVSRVNICLSQCPAGLLETTSASIKATTTTASARHSFWPIQLVVSSVAFILRTVCCNF